MSDTILAVDLGRYKGVACEYRRATRQYAFRTIDTTPGVSPTWRTSAIAPTVTLPDPATRQRRMLIAFRQELVGRRGAEPDPRPARRGGAARAAGHRAW
jgi:hypothetical protein